jgi:tetratricopeptide (TPR) repeat protein
MKKIVFTLLLLTIFFQIVLAQNLGEEREKIKALQAIENAEKQIEEMKKLGFGVKYANDTLNEAKLLFERGDYLAAESVANYVEVIKQTAMKVYEMIDKVESKVYDARSRGINVSVPMEIFNQGIKMFEIEDYKEAEKLITEAEEKLEEIEAEQAFSKTIEKSKEYELVLMIKENWHIILFSIIFLSSFGYFVYKRLEIRAIKNKTKTLVREKEALEKMMKDVQRMYFVEKKMGKKEYTRTIERCGRRLVEVKKNLEVLRQKVKSKL